MTKKSKELKRKINREKRRKYELSITIGLQPSFGVSSSVVVSKSQLKSVLGEPTQSAVGLLLGSRDPLPSILHYGHWSQTLLFQLHRLIS